ncbi:MAG: hypothetical protein K8R74_06725 [Bacteroidales bacterium]|nr:hypothetical protein [Bacteroidales bacterium]
MDVGEGNVLAHGIFQLSSTGSLTIDGGNFICDGPYNPNHNCFLFGTFNMDNGLFEITNNPLRIEGPSSINGGIIRVGSGFLAPIAGCFQPTGGSVELIGTGSINQFIKVDEANYFYDLVIDRTNTLDIFSGYNLNIKNDFTLSGGLDSNTCDIYIGGSWVNSAGSSAFIENTGSVFFDGTGDVSITPGETFYNLTLDKASSADWLTLSGNVTALGDLVVNGGALHTGDNTLDVYGNIDINSSANLFVQAGGTLKVGDNKDLVADLGSSFYIEGSPSNYATLTHSGTGRYDCNIFGEIAANYAIFEFMGLSGINIKEGATVNPIYTFNNCIFQNGAPAPSALLTLNNDQVFTCSNAYFENTFGNTQYNVWKHFDTGNATLQGATGDFAGPEFEYDPNNRIHWTDIDVTLDLNVMLEGPYNGIDMNINLNTLELIPHNQPFSSNSLASWYYDGTEYVASIPSNVTDWVLVELRDASSAAEAMPGDVVAKQAALLLNNGSIVDLDGTSNLNFTEITYSSGLFPVIWHRNHLGIISSDKMSRTDGVFTYDFTQAGSAYNNTNPGEKLLGGSVWGMFGGDSNGSGLVALGDLSNDWAPYAGETGYRPADYNLDGQLNNKDKNDVWFENLLKLSQIPGSKKTD